MAILEHPIYTKNMQEYIKGWHIRKICTCGFHIDSTVNLMVCPDCGECFKNTKHRTMKLNREKYFVETKAYWPFKHKQEKFNFKWEIKNNNDLNIDIIDAEKSVVRFIAI